MSKSELEKIEMRVYESMCSRCPQAVTCHEDCSTCSSYDDAITEALWETIPHKGYEPTIVGNTGLVEIQFTDEDGIFDCDEDAVAQAKKDGFKLIPLDEIPEFSRKWEGYLDTYHNRDLLFEHARRERLSGKPIQP